MYVCICNDKTNNQIVEIIQEKNINNFNDLINEIDVCQGCGCCTEIVKKIIDGTYCNIA